MLIIEETIEGTAGYTIRYIYDDNNLLLGFIYNNTTYYYQRTLTGDIARIVDEAGEIQGEYIYDAFGNILNLDALSEIAEINPFRYKGYYYDQETNLYYCKSRYYSPEIYRWLSRDAIEYLDPSSVEGCNLYVYCNNNPIMYVDENGNSALGLFVICLLGIVITAGILSLDTLHAETTYGTFDFEFMELEKDSLNFVTIGGSVGRKDWYLDKEKNRSIYFKGFNLGSSLSLTKETSNINEILEIDASIFEVGFEGKYINFHYALGYNQDYVSINLDWLLSNKNNERNN